jgi:hypothetical protein
VNATSTQGLCCFATACYSVLHNAALTQPRSTRVLLHHWLSDCWARPNVAGVCDIAVQLKHWLYHTAACPGTHDHHGTSVRPVLLTSSSNRWPAAATGQPVSSIQPISTIPYNLQKQFPVFYMCDNLRKGWTKVTKFPAKLTCIHRVRAAEIAPQLQVCASCHWMQGCGTAAT